jgi:hypothetical protein
MVVRQREALTPKGRRSKLAGIINPGERRWRIEIEGCELNPARTMYTPERR